MLNLNLTVTQTLTQTRTRAESASTLRGSLMVTSSLSEYDRDSQMYWTAPNVFFSIVKDHDTYMARHDGPNSLVGLRSAIAFMTFPYRASRCISPPTRFS